METYQNLKNLIKYYDTETKVLEEDIKNAFEEIKNARDIEEQRDAEESLSLLHSELSRCRSVAHYLKSYQGLVK